MKLQFGDELVKPKSDLQKVATLNTENIDLATNPTVAPIQPETNPESNPQKIIPVKRTVVKCGESFESFAK